LGRRLDGKSDRQRTVGRRSAADRYTQWITVFNSDKIQIAGEEATKKPLLSRQISPRPVILSQIVDRIGRVWAAP